MLSNEEIEALKALDLAPEVEQVVIRLEEKHRQLLFARGRRIVERRAEATASNGADRADQSDEDDVKTVSGSKRSLKKKAELIPWHVQFSE